MCLPKSCSYKLINSSWSPSYYISSSIASLLINKRATRSSEESLAVTFESNCSWFFKSLFFICNSIRFFFIIIAFLGLIVLKPRRGVFPSKNCWTFYFSIVLGGSVYLSILIYHIYTLFDIPPLEILTLLMI